MQAVTITQITPFELTQIIEGCLVKALMKINQSKELPEVFKQISDSSFKDWCEYRRDEMTVRLFNTLLSNFENGKYKNISMTEREFKRGRGAGPKMFKEFSNIRGY